MKRRGRRRERERTKRLWREDIVTKMRVYHEVRLWSSRERHSRQTRESTLGRMFHSSQLHITSCVSINIASTVYVIMPLSVSIVVTCVFIIFPHPTTTVLCAPLVVTIQLWRTFIFSNNICPRSLLFRNEFIILFHRIQSNIARSEPERILSPQDLCCPS